MIIPLEFPFINVSCQVGDVALVSITENNQSGVNHPGSTENTKPIILGLITAVYRGASPPWISVDTNANGGCGTCDDFLGRNIANAYVFFRKEDHSNTSGVTGYFLEAEYRNYSTLPAEMFATAADYVVSSK